MVSFTPEQKSFIRQVVFEAAPFIIEAHVNSCPWGRKMNKLMWIGIGVGVSLTFFGLTTFAGLQRFLTHAN